jgi:hypothetical protein
LSSKQTLESVDWVPLRIALLWGETQEIEDIKAYVRGLMQGPKSKPIGHELTSSCASASHTNVKMRKTSEIMAKCVPQKCIFIMKHETLS